MDMGMTNDDGLFFESDIMPCIKVAFNKMTYLLSVSFR